MQTQFCESLASALLPCLEDELSFLSKCNVSNFMSFFGISLDSTNASHLHDFLPFEQRGLVYGHATGRAMALAEKLKRYCYILSHFDMRGVRVL